MIAIMVVDILIMLSYFKKDVPRSGIILKDWGAAIAKTK
jgi:hypothetical protein